MKYLILLWISMVPAQLAAQDTLWTKSYGTSASDGAKSICQANDEGYVIVGYSFTSQVKIPRLMLLKINSGGEEAWRRIPELPGAKYPNDICRLRDDICSTSDGNYLISGTTTSKGFGVEDLYALKIDDEGTVIWEKPLEEASLIPVPMFWKLLMDFICLAVQPPPLTIPLHQAGTVICLW